MRAYTEEQVYKKKLVLCEYQERLVPTNSYLVEFDKDIDEKYLLERALTHKGEYPKFEQLVKIESIKYKVIDTVYTIENEFDKNLMILKSESGEVKVNQRYLKYLLKGLKDYSIYIDNDRMAIIRDKDGNLKSLLMGIID